jgi:polysaccharide biosynthesis/export protein VpsN
MRVILTIGLLAMLPLGAAEPPPRAPKGRIAPVVNIGGQVRHPGPLAWRKNLTIFDAILEAGGATEFGSLRRVKVSRDGTAKSYDLNDDKAKMIPVLPDDTIEVPQKNLFGR